MTNYLEKGSTMTGARYADLIVKLHQELVRKRRGALRRGVWLLHDNAPAHTSHIVQATLREQNIFQLPHPPYSPDLSPCDYYLFPKLKEYLRGKRFGSNEEVQEEVEHWLGTQPTNFYFQGIQALRHRLQKCIALLVVMWRNEY